MNGTFVIAQNGIIFVQIEDLNSQHGFYLTDDDQTYDGGYGSGAITWEAIEPNDPRISEVDHERLDWLLGGDHQ